MSESTRVSERPIMALPSTENTQGVVDQLATTTRGSRKRQQTPHSRPLLSCTTCRERKVKCDRTIPCSACCARGQPKGCYFIAEDDDYQPIQQSYEIRKLRAENLRLKQKLRTCKIRFEDDESEHTTPPDSVLGERPTSSASKHRGTLQKRLQSSTWSDSIYFGSPSFANIVKDFSNINPKELSSQSLTHIMPRGLDMYTARTPSPHPFATLFEATPEQCIPQLLDCLPNRSELLEYLTFFEKGVDICAFPFVPLEINRSDVERFLSEPGNAQICPDMLGLIFAALAMGSQHSVWYKAGSQWQEGTTKEEMRKGNVYIAAAMQALRMTPFMQRPTLLAIESLIMIGSFLTNSSRFLDAWTLFGTTIRLAQSIGLNRDPKYLNPPPPTEQACSVRQELWWWMLHMDQEYSMTLGRPLGISAIGDCPLPDELTTDNTRLRFGEFVIEFTGLGRQILSCESLNHAKIDEFTDSLGRLLETMPKTLRFDESWLEKKREFSEWPLEAMSAIFYCKIQTYLVVLNCQRVDEPTHPSSHQASAINKAPPPGSHPMKRSVLPDCSPTTSPETLLRGRALVLSSCQNVITAFLFFYRRLPAALIDWTIGQQAFHSSMILLTDAIETRDHSRIRSVDTAYVVFMELKKNGVHELATQAVERISLGLSKINPNKDNDATAMSEQRVEPGGDVEMQGNSADGTTQRLGTMQDTVMGNTGLFLLEDPGLQSFVTEAYAPLKWGTKRARRENASPTSTKIKEEQELEQGELGPFMSNKMKRLASKNSAPEARSSERMQGAQQWAPGSAPLRYATRPTAPPQEQFQPQSLRRTSTGLHQPAPPNLRHYSYPSLHQTPSQNIGAQLHHIEQRQQREDSNVGDIDAGTRRQTGQRNTTWNKSIPIPDLESPIPPFATYRPVNAQSESAATATASLHPSPFTGHPNAHLSSAARPAAPISYVSEPTFLSVSDRNQAIPAFGQQYAPMPTWQGTVPYHPSSATVEPMLAHAGPQTEQDAFEVWEKNCQNYKS